MKDSANYQNSLLEADEEMVGTDLDLSAEWKETPQRGRESIETELVDEHLGKEMDRAILNLMEGKHEGSGLRAAVAAVENVQAKNVDGVILGCTEIPLLVDPDDCPLPVLDSTRLLSRAALNEALA